MSVDRELVPDWALHPGAILSEVLQAKGLRQSELAERTGISPKHVNQIIKQTIGISPDIAILLERALGVAAQFWINADADFQIFESRRRAAQTLDEYQGWASHFDTSTLVRNGVIEPRETGISRVEKILKLFQVATPVAFEQTWQRPSVSFRRSQAFSIDEPNTALWLRLVERSANDVPVATYNPKALRKAVRQMPALTSMTLANGFIAARAALAEAGVALTFVREIPGTRVCAATWWITGDKPAIGVTERQRRLDVFWFNLFHEIAHIVLHPRRTSFLDLDDRKSADPIEQEADAYACELLFPDNSNVEIAHARTHRDLILVAARLGIGVSSVAGCYGKLTGKWSFVSKLREQITDSDVAALEQLVDRAAD